MLDSDMYVDLNAEDVELVAEAKLNEVLRSKSPLHITVDRLADLLRGHRELIDDARNNFSVLDPLIVHLESRLFSADDADRLLLELCQSRENLKLLNDAYCAWETALEQLFSLGLRSGQACSLQDYRLDSRFERLLTRETSMLRNKAPKRALFIGSGPFPISAIWLHRILGIPVDGLDVSLDAVTGSHALIEKLNLNGAINIIHESSECYDVSDYDVIIVALLAKPKQAILNNIFESAKDDCDVICRTSFGQRCIIYEPTVISREMIGMFSIEDTRVVGGNSDDTISSLLLRKSTAR